MQGQSTHDTNAGEREKRSDEPDEGHGMAPGPGIQGNQSTQMFKPPTLKALHIHIIGK